MNYMLDPRSLWVFDFDGTLSPIVPARNEARLHRECEAAKEEFACPRSK